MPSPMPDAIALAVAYLRGLPAVTSLVSTRIYGNELHRSIETQMPIKVIVIRASGGRPDDGYLPLGRPRIDVRCYGETPIEAMRVHREAYWALKSLRRFTNGDGLLHSATPESGAINLREPGGDWPFVLSTHILRVAEESLTG